MREILPILANEHRTRKSTHHSRPEAGAPALENPSLCLADNGALQHDFESIPLSTCRSAEKLAGRESTQQSSILSNRAVSAPASQGTRTLRIDWGSVGVGALIGGAAGALIGGALGGGLGALIGGGIGAVGGAIVGGLAGSSGGAGARPSLALRGNSYADSGGTSRKHIFFDVTVPASLRAQDYCLVQKVQGTFIEADGRYSKVMMYGSQVDANFPSEVVDSTDADPVYHSNSAARWNYSPISNGFSADDDVGGPSYAYPPGTVAALKFKIGIYTLASVPTTTTGTISASPIQELPWQFSVASDAAGNISHPAL